MVMCEECERKEAEVDALIDGDYRKLCKNCAAFAGAVVVERPSQQRIDASQYSRPKVRQVLSRMAGITKDNYSPGSDKPAVRNPYANLRIPASRKQVSLDDLREVKRSNEAEEKQLNAEVGGIEDVEAEVEEKKDKVSWFSRFFGKKNKEQRPAEKVETMAGPAAGVEDMTAKRVRIIDSRL